MAKNQRGIGIAMSYISVGIGLFTTIFYTALVNIKEEKMFITVSGEKKEVKEAAAKVDYIVKVDVARATKNDSIVMVDLDVNGVKIKSCMLKEATVKEDGEKHKKGDTVYFLNFPSEKVGDKYYNRAWFPVSNANLEDIIKQVDVIRGLPLLEGPFYMCYIKLNNLL